jgi:hypothetical protein
MERNARAMQLRLEFPERANRPVVAGQRLLVGQRGRPSKLRGAGRQTVRSRKSPADTSHAQLLSLESL